MARPLRVEFDGAWHHVMNRGAGRRLVFRGHTHRSMFLQLLAETSATYDIEIHAYCLMGNHYHLLLRTPHSGLARAMRVATPSDRIGGKTGRRGKRRSRGCRSAGARSRRAVAHGDRVEGAHRRLVEGERMEAKCQDKT